MASSKKRNKFRKILSNIAGTPGYIFLLLVWLLLAGSILYILGRSTGVTPHSTAQQTETIVSVGQTGILENLLVIIIGAVIWYLIADVLRKTIENLADRFTNPQKFKNIISYGALTVGWLLLAANTLIISGGLSGLAIACVVALAISLSSLGVENWLIKTWHLE